MEFHSNYLKCKKHEDGINIFPREYVSGKELAVILSISQKTISNKSFSIRGRLKIGGSVRYHLPTIEKALQQGLNLFIDIV